MIVLRLHSVSVVTRKWRAKYGVKLVDNQQDTYKSYNAKGMQLNVCDFPMSLDFLINMPVLKGHCQTTITCALKNNKGLIPNSEKR